MRFSGEYPLRYVYGELNATGMVRYDPRAYIPGLWLYVEVSSYQGREAQFRLEQRRTGGIAGVNELLVVGPDGSGTYESSLPGVITFKLTDEQLSRLRALIIGNNFIEVKPEKFDPRQDTADYFAYSLSITYLRNGQQTGRKTVYWVDEWALKEKLPESLRQIHEGVGALIRDISQSEIVDEKKAATFAISVVKDSATFQFDGIEGSLTAFKVTKLFNEPPTEYLWVVEVAFATAHPGHGNRSGMILPQVITEHRAVISLDELGKVVTAVCDKEWDILEKRKIPDESTLTTSFIAVVNGIRRLKIEVDVDPRDGISESEARLIAEDAFTSVMGKEVLRKLNRLKLTDGLLLVHYTWGYSAEDLGHVFDATAELRSFAMLVAHCR